MGLTNGPISTSLCCKEINLTEKNFKGAMKWGRGITGPVTGPGPEQTNKTLN